VVQFRIVPIGYRDSSRNAIAAQPEHCGKYFTNPLRAIAVSDKESGVKTILTGFALLWFRKLKFAIRFNKSVFLCLPTAYNQCLLHSHWLSGGTHLV